MPEISTPSTTLDLSASLRSFSQAISALTDTQLQMKTAFSQLQSGLQLPNIDTAQLFRAAEYQHRISEVLQQSDLISSRLKDMLSASRQSMEAVTAVMQKYQTFTIPDSLVKALETSSLWSSRIQEITSAYSAALKSVSGVQLSETTCDTISRSLLSAQQHMSEEQLHAVEAAVPDLRDPSHVAPISMSHKRWSAKDLLAVLSLLLQLIQIYVGQLPDKQLDQLIDNTDIIIEQNYEMIEQNYEMIEQQDEELSLLRDLCLAAQEVSDALDEISEEDDDTFTEEDAPDASDSPEEAIS